MLGVKQTCIGGNKLACETAGCKQARHDEIGNEMKNMLVETGWKKDILKSTLVMPISGGMCDNLLVSLRTSLG